MKKIFITAICLLTVLIVGCGDNTGTTGKEKIVAGIDESPIDYIDKNGEFVGFEVDLIKETAKRMGVKVEFKKVEWNKMEEELNAGNIDFIWNGMDITPERKQRLLFSKPYMDNRQIVAVTKDSNLNIHSESDLAGKIVGVKSGTTAEMYITNDEDLKNSLKELKTYPDNTGLFQALKDGNIDLLVCDEILVRYEMIKNGGSFKALEVAIGSVAEMGIAFRKDNTELRDRVQKAYDEMVKDGAAKKISEKWFQADLIKHKR